MPIYWVAANAPGIARGLSQATQQNIAAALAAAGWLIAAGIALWQGSDSPSLPDGVELEFCAPQDPPEYYFY
jgi:hypothetical protein